LTPLKGTHLAAGAWRAMQANARALLPVGLAYAAFTVIAEQAATRMGLTEPSASVGFLTYGLLSGAVGAVLSGLTLRTLLLPAGRRFRLEPGLLAYVAVVTVAGLVMNMAMLGYAAGMPTETQAVADPSAALGRSLAIMVAFFVGLWLWLRLTLWPVGLAVGDRDMRPGRSFRLMAGAVWPVIFGSMILGIGPFFVYAIALYQSQAQGNLWGSIIGAPFLAFFAMSTAAVSGEAYRQRVGGASRTASASD
jgi:hypothetical protein